MVFMYIYQPDRALLEEQLRKVSQHICGKTLDIGAGEFNRYGRMFTTTSYTKMDVHAGPNVDIVGSIEKIPFEAETFDSIVCTQVFEHLPHPEKSAAEVFRVLKKGGHLVMTVPQMNELHEEPYDFFRYTKFGLQTLFTEAGFAVVSCEQRGGYFTLVAQLISRYLIDKLRLHKHPLSGRIMSRFFQCISWLAISLDRLDTSPANRKHTIGWCLVCRK